MELHIALICAGVFVISAVLIYLISIFGMKEKTYEEAIAEQRLRPEEAWLHSKSEKVQKSQRVQKKVKIKIKEKPTTTNVSSPAHLASNHNSKITVPLENDNELTKEKKAKPNKNITAKSVSVNREEKVVDTTRKRSQSHLSKELNTTQDEVISKLSSDKKEPQVKKESQPKKELQIKKEPQDKKEPHDKKEPQDKKELPNKKESVAKDVKKEESPKKDESKNDFVKKKQEKTTNTELRTKHEEDKVKTVPSLTESIPIKKSKKTRSEDTLRRETDETFTDRYLNILKTATLSEVDIQTFIDVLLNKQQGANQEWTKKGQKTDPVAVLKKQLQESETSLSEQKQLAQTASLKLKELRQELGQEKSRYQQLDRSTKETLANQSQEIKTLHSRLQHNHDQHLAEVNSAQTKLQQAVEEIKNIKEESRQLKETKAKLENDQKSSLSEISKLQKELKLLKSEKEDYERKRNQSDKCEKDLKDLNSQYQKRIEKLEITQKEEEETRKKHANDLKEKLKKANADQEVLSEKLKQLDKGRQSIEKENTTLKNKVHQLEEIQDKFKEVEKEKLEVESKLLTLKSQLNELNNQQACKDKEIQELREENEILSAQVSASQRAAAEGQEDVCQQEDQSLGKLNGGIRSEDLENKALIEQENIVKELREDLNYKTEVTRLAEEVEQLKKKNNNLREKNWKAMDALSAAEKTAEHKLNVALKNWQEKKKLDIEEDNTHTKELLQRIFPDVQINTFQNHSDWLSKFEKEAIERLQRYSSQADSQESHQKKLQIQVHHYKTVLKETEAVLHRLQISVESAEKKWKDQISVLTLDLEQVKAEKKILEDSLEHIKAAEETTSEVCGLKFAYKCVERSLPNIVDEMEVKLRELQHKLEGEELERRMLQEKHNCAIVQTAELEENLTAFQKEIDNLKQQNLNSEASQKELAELKNSLEKEKKNCKDLSSQVVKLSSLVKIGEDSLKQEQEERNKLQEKLQSMIQETTPIQNQTSCSEVEEPNLSCEERPLLKGAAKPRKLERRKRAAKAQSDA